MKIDGTFGLGDAAEAAGQLEATGYDGAFSGETSSDPFLACALAAQGTTRLDVGTSIAVAFARNPMTTAVTAYDLQRLSEGRFILGLGSQVKAHIERRYAMPWSQPAARMHEYIAALRAIWRCWETGEALDFRGEFYSHTLMTPAFDPGPLPVGPPKVLLAAVGPRMTEIAGEVCDGLIAHAFTTPRYLRDVTLPAVEAGRCRRSGPPTPFDVKLASLVVTGRDANELAACATGARKQIAFYGSTPAYRDVLERQGWGSLQGELHELAREGRWDDMADAIDDEVLDTFAVVGEPDHVGGEIRRRYGDIVTRISVYSPAPLVPEVLRAVMHGLRV